MVFRKRGRLINDEVGTYGGNTIDAVEDFNYLGTVFHYTGNFLETQRTYCWEIAQSSTYYFINY